ncbi:MAG: DUF2804 family protein [Labilithrix sp.]|nr:DUF2804 family protein [Labilithrix sp.]
MGVARGGPHGLRDQRVRVRLRPRVAAHARRPERRRAPARGGGGRRSPRSGAGRALRPGRTSIAVERRPRDGRRAGAPRGRTRSSPRASPISVDVAIDEATAPPAISAIAEIGPSLASATEKRALAAVRGSLVASGRRVSLDGALGGYDYTHGLMPRHTRWRWAFAMGRAADGAAVAFNVVEGFVGEAECAAFAPGGVFPIREPRFDFDAARPDAPWRLVGEGIDLTFDVGAVHAQRTNLVLVRSRFLQPAGTFRGTLRIDGRDVALEGVPGVVEDQDVLW